MLSRFFLVRPVFAWVIAIMLMVLGCLAIYELPIAQYPPIAPPSIRIGCLYAGASAETVENSVTQIIEQQMTGLDKMWCMASSSDSSGIRPGDDVRYDPKEFRQAPGGGHDPRHRTNFIPESLT